MKQKIKENQQNCSTKRKINKDKATTPLHKQFQFMYRTCDRLPSSQQYQSVIFMKHHKISPNANLQKQIRKNKKHKCQLSKKNKNYHKSAQQIKKKHNDKNNKMITTKSTAPFSTFSRNFQQQTYPRIVSDFGQQVKEPQEFKQKEQIFNYNKQINIRNNIKNIKNLKTINQKRVKDSKRSQKQYKFDKSMNSYSKRNNNKMNNNSNGFIVIEDSFFEIGRLSLQNLQQKLLTNNKGKKQKQIQFLSSLHEQKIQSKQTQLYKLQGDSYIPQKLQLQTVKKYINQKVLIIQRWWRKIKQNKQKQNKQKYNDIQQIKQQKRQQIKDNNIQQKKKQRQTFNEQENEQIIRKLVNQRQVTALNHMKSQKCVLNQLYQAQKITQIVYSNKINKIQFQFQNEMYKINQLKQVLIQNRQRIKHLQQKIKQQNQITKNINSMGGIQIAQKLFSPQSSQQNQQHFVLSAPLNQSRSFNRKKATGCHYSNHSPQSITNKLYHKRSQKIKQQFESESSQQQMQVKIQQSNMCEILQYYNDRQKAQNQIQKRHAIQIGMIIDEQKDQKSINTSVLGIHSFLVNFLKFYSYFYKDQFLKMINMPYGSNPRRRLYNLHGFQLQQQGQQYEDGIIYGVKNVITQQILQDFHQHNYQQCDNNSIQIRQKINLQKYHHKAIIDAFNQTLNCFRPYYYISNYDINIDGPPYSWNHSQKALTFYFVAQQNIRQVFDKCQFKVLKWCSSLCGVICDSLTTQSNISEDMSLHQKLLQYKNCVNAVLAQTRQQKLGKSQKQEIQRTNYQWFLFQQDQTSLLMQISSSIYYQLIQQFNNDFILQKI